MSATATVTNGKPQRKQLADQLDRLDSIIDVLADGLPQAVADATREGARQAVKDVILELLTNPELRTLIAGLAPAAQSAPAEIPAGETSSAPPTEATPAKPSFWSRVKEKCKAAKDGAARRCRAAKAAVGSAYRTLAAVMPLKKILLVGAGVGVAVATVSYLCPHTVSAAVSGVCGAAAAVGIQIGNWFRRSAGLFGFGKG
jgi:hypothetical protein